MPTFDGDNLLITLDSGVTEVDVINDIYEPWKDWMLASPLNRRYPQAFTSDGGNPLTPIINQGSYIFLQNNYGWRIKPPEEDITIYLTGNLAVSDTNLPAFVETTGAFTAAILGLQPVTQGVSESLVTNLEQALFLNGVYIDKDNGFAGTGDVDGIPIGSLGKPSNNFVDAKTIADARAVRQFVLLSTGNVLPNGADYSAGYTWVGDRRSNSIANQLVNSADLRSNVFKNLTFAGNSENAVRFEDCEFIIGTQASGYLIRCGFAFDFSLSGQTWAIDCFSLIPGLSYPIINIGNNALVMRKYHGSIGVENMTGTPIDYDHSIEVYGGKVIFESTCTGSTAHVRGEPLSIVDNSNGTSVLDETESEKVNRIYEKDGLNASKPVTRTPTSTTFDDVTIEHTGDSATSITTTRTG